MHENNIDIAIIDDGVYENFFDINPLKCKIEITPDLEVIQQVDYRKGEHENNIPNHGTICASIIHKFAPDASLGSIKILNHKRRGVREQLIRAIEWCVEEGIKIINLSLGTIHYNDSHELRKTINSAAANGAIIVSASSNQLITTYPSCFSNVIGVKTDTDFTLKEGEYTYNYHPNDGIDITGCSVFSLLQYNGKMYCSNRCNSYATPFITSKVYGIVKENPGVTLGEVKLKLMEGALNKKDKPERLYLSKNIDWMENALVFDFNNPKNKVPKENQYFRIVGQIDLVCDCYCSGAESIKNLLDMSSRQFTEFDTVIINGSDLTSKHTCCTSEKLIQEIINRGKNLVYLDDKDIDRELSLSVHDNITKIWHPSIFNYLDIPILKEIDIPLISLNDFTGRYLLKLMEKLQECFRADGYNIVSGSDTGPGIVYGINYAPLFNKWVLNEYDPAGLKTLCGLYDPDILIFGINASDKDTDYLDCKIKSFEVDIDIIISDDCSNNVKDYINLSRKNGSQLVFLTPEKAAYEELEIYQDIKVFDLSCDFYVSDVYKYIIDLYNV